MTAGVKTLWRLAEALRRGARVWHRSLVQLYSTLSAHYTVS